MVERSKGSEMKFSLVLWYVREGRSGMSSNKKDEEVGRREVEG